MTPQQSLSRPSTRSWSHGFSLVELSIVLVILGLLTGGILAGQDLIRSAELRAVTTEFQEYQAAVQTFRNKYMALPGDMDNATRFWGELDSDRMTCRDMEANGTATCDGNGNGSLGGASGSDAFRDEPHRFWQHLANAGLINGRYTGTDSETGDGCCDDTYPGNAPASFSDRLVWSALGSIGQTQFAELFNGEYGNFLILSGGHNAMWWKSTPIVTPAEIWNIDTKMDDGKPGRGQLVAYHTTAHSIYDNCTDRADASDLDADYQLDVDSKACGFIFRNLF